MRHGNRNRQADNGQKGSQVEKRKPGKMAEKGLKVLQLVRDNNV